jgi:Ca-activated chloride channel family protein
MAANSLGRWLGLIVVFAWAGAAGAAAAADSGNAADAAPAVENNVTQGALRIVQKDGGIVECPLKHTDVQADIAGFVARVKVTQTFHNPTKEKIEAVYVFPLPHESAVDDMTMVIGERKIVGLIKRRAEARSIYEQALLAGQTAALLEQERPNIFTQSVGNIEPGQEVRIEISYVDVLRYDMGTYEFAFPMVVGPRYIPGTPSGSTPPTPKELEGKVSPPVPDTDRVPDASRISPPVLKPGVRNGHDVSLSISLDAGVPIQNLKSANHEATIEKGERTAAIKLSEADSIPNKDFVLRYGVVGKKPEMALLAHTGDYSGDRRQLGNGYFMLMIQPKEDERLTKSPPREIIFLCDVSGSMSGEPTAKVIEAMQGMLKLCRPQDTLQVVTFAGQATKLFDKPVPVNDENIGKALGFSAGFEGRGGTEMLKGVQMAIDEPIDKERLRIVVMLTDGYIGNEAEIIEHVGKHCGDQIRFWCVGIGSAPNMFLVDGVAKQGGGMGKQLGLADESQPLVQEIMTRIQRAQLAKLKIDWGELKVSETYPAKLPELWAGRPVIVYGRYAPPANHDESVVLATVTVSGNVEGEDVSWPVKVDLPIKQPKNDVLSKVWARKKIEDLMQQTYYHGSPAVEEMVTGIALDYKLMSQYTSFVAVDTSQPAAIGEAAKMPRRMLVPVPLPHGTRWEGFFGDEMGEGEVDRLSSLKDGFAFGLVRQKQELKELSKSINDLRRSTFRVEGRYKLADRPISARFAKGALPMANRAFSAAGAVPLAASPSPASGLGLGGGGFGGAPVGKRLGRGGRAYYAREQASRGLRVEKLAEALDGSEVAAVAVTDSEIGYTANALAAHAVKYAEAARKLLETATGKEPPADPQAVRLMLTQACFLDTAAANVGQSDGSVASEAIAKLEELHDQDVQDWIKKHPQLGTKLNLVIRDQSLAEAIAQVAKAAKLDVSLVEGSVQDAVALQGPTAGRVTWLDLRHATAAQALDWILQPVGLAWWPAGKGIAAGSERRRSGETAWTYDVGAIALPLDDDLTKLNDYNKAVEASQKSADEFLAALREALKIKDESLVWFAPGQLLLVGTSEQHLAAAKVIASLEQGKDKPAGKLAALADVTRKRFAARQEKLAKAREAEALLEIAAIHDHYSWQLLAAAAGGQLDQEALTELQIAWKAPQTAELLGGPARPLALRSLWTIIEAARALPREQELGALAAMARERSQDAALAAVAAVEKDKSDQPALASVVYAGLAKLDDGRFQAKIGPLVTAQAGEDPAADLRLLARILVGESAKTDAAAMEKLLAQNPQGADLVVLTALASLKSGGDQWTAFRAASRDLLGGQPLPGEVVALINRLGQSGIQLARASD